MAIDRAKRKNTTAAKTATVTADVIEEAVEEVAETVVEETVTTKTYKEDDGILCRSITRGELIYIGKKSKEKYIFANHDDTCEIEVRDLNSLKASKSPYLYKPLFVIEDTEFLSQKKWKDIKEMYDKVVNQDIDVIINKPLPEFRAILMKLPDGYKEALEREVASRIHADEFDSLKKIKAIDEICGTDLYCLISS